MDMRGYGESGKPQGRHAYRREKLVEDVRQLIQNLGIKLIYSKRILISRLVFN